MGEIGQHLRPSTGRTSADSAARLVNEAVYLTETETATGAELLCRCKRIEDPGQDFRRDPRSVIGDLDCQVAAGQAMQRLVLCRYTEQNRRQASRPER